VLGVGVFDGDGNAFAFFVDPQDYELSGLLLTSNARSFEDEPLDSGGDELGVDDLEQGRSVGSGL
jgi:hypothetical protein